MSISNEKRKTITSIFMMPTLGHNFQLLKSYGYIAAYAEDNSQEHKYDDAIYALFKPKNFVLFNEFLEKEYKRTHLLIEDYNLDEHHVVLVYKQLPAFKADYDLVKAGKYSKTSKEFQALFSKKIYIYDKGFTQEEESIQYKIFNKTKDLVLYCEELIGQKVPEGQELWTMYEVEKEILNFNHGN